MNLNKIIEIDFLKCFKALLRNYKITLFVTLIAFTIGIGTTSFVIDSNNEYEATSSVYGIVYGSFTDSSDILNSLKAYGEVVKSHKIAERASLLIGDDTIDKDKIYDMISVEYDSSTLDYSAIIYIHATYYDKDVAIDVANAVAEAFVLEIANLTGKNDIQILDTADNATISYNANQTKIKTLAISIILGFIIGCAYIVIREIFSDKMYAPKDATDYGKLDIIGVIPDFDTDKDFNLYLSDNDTN
ncbi:Capsular polysaccharide biosynthesis protein [Lachnospiraceae bacterium RM5]|nr:Capsular polysaccharide biosynthesis protein [Lachnospiraceae bacterium RM5]